MLYSAMEPCRALLLDMYPWDPMGLSWQVCASVAMQQIARGQVLATQISAAEHCAAHLKTGAQSSGLQQATCSTALIICC